MPFLGMHAAGPHRGPGAAAPGAFSALFRGQKCPAGGSTRLPSFERLRQTQRAVPPLARIARALAINATSRDPAVGAAISRPPGLCCQSAFFERTRLRRVRADVGIGPYVPPGSRLARRGAHRASERLHRQSACGKRSKPKPPLCKGRWRGEAMPEGLSAVSHRVRLSPQFRAAPKEGLGCGDGNGLFNLPAYLPETAKRRFPEFSQESGA